MKIGYHISITGGLQKCANIIKEQKLSSVQIFPGSPRSYYPSKHKQDDLDAFNNLNIHKFVHINYFVNPASDNKNNIPSLIENLKFSDSIGASGLIVHMGSNENIQKGLKLTESNIRKAYENSNAKTQLLLETTAEGGNKLKLPYIVDFINNNKDLNIGMCLDTCHIYAAGYNVIESIEKYKDYIKCIHLNNPNPEVEFGGHLDRHNISLFHDTAKLSKIEIENIINLGKLYNIPMVLETGDQYNDFLICENKYNY